VKKGGDCMDEKEMLRELLSKFDALLQIKYAGDKDKMIERQLELCRIELSAFNSVNIEQLEEKYK
jgi:hypothetical protein